MGDTDPISNNFEVGLETKLKNIVGKGSVCRLCFNYSNSLSFIKQACKEALPPILKFNLSKIPVVDILQFYVGDEIKSYAWNCDEVCQECMWKIFECYDFINYCRLVEKVLKNHAADYLPEFTKGEHEDLSYQFDANKSVEIKSENTEDDICIDTSNEIFTTEQTHGIKDFSEDEYQTYKTKETRGQSRVAKRSLILEVDREIEEAIVSGPHICSVCEEQCDNAKLLIEHRKCHGFDIHQCVKCGKGFTTSRGVRIHMRQHYDARPEVCTTCGAAFRDPRSLRTHCATKHVGIKPFECSDCSKRFAKKIALQLHLKTHTGDRPHVCDVCGKSYIQAHSLVVHKRQHSGEKPYACKVCLKTFSNGSSLKMHLPVHADTKDYVCTVCGKMVARVSELNVHMRMHTGLKPFECKSCGKGFTSSSALTRHKVTHSGEKLHVCNVCFRRYSQPNELSKHMRSHTGSKLPLNCQLCPALLSSRAALRRHYRIHTGEKRHKCPQCERAFTELHVLKNHMRTHSGVKPFTCAICSRSFSQSVTLKAHLKVHVNQTKPAESHLNSNEDVIKQLPIAFL